MTADKIIKLNSRFNTVMTKLDKYEGTDMESVIQQAYNKYFSIYFDLDSSEIRRVEKCDSYFNKDKLNLLIEYKADVNFSDNITRSKVIAQTVFYYKRIIDHGVEKIPNVVFIGDSNECFCFKSKYLNKFLNLPGVDYSVAASSAGDQTVLLNAIMSDEDLKNTIFIINPQVDSLSYICEKMISMSFDKEANIPINENNIHRVFESFVKNVVNDKKYDPNMMVGLFIDAIKHPENRIIAGDLMIVYPYKPIKIFTNKAIAMFNFFGRPSDEDTKNLTMIYDTLVKDSERRKKGFFITPTIWVDLAHKYVSDYFESIGWDRNWEDNENVVVWDCCCGTKSLTRDYRFKNLYLSTLEEGELNASVELSPEAKETFIFDFLNDPLSKLPESLQNELRGLAKNKDKKLVFLTNPPYGQGAAMGKAGKTKITETMIQREMTTKKLKYAARELFVQFIYRMNSICEYYHLNKEQIVIATFSKPTFMCGDASINFREFWLNSWNFDSAFLFNASEFAGCSSAWGVSFSVWNNTKSKVSEFIHDIYDNVNEEAIKIDSHIFYNADNFITMDEWLREGLSTKTHKVVCFKNSFVPVKSSERCVPSKDNFGVVEGWMNYICSFGTCVQNGFANIYSAPSVSPGTSITSSNMYKAVQAFAARTITVRNWINDKDVYLKPNESHPKYQEWINDCFINAIDSVVMSVSGTVDGESYDYKNNFFPFSKSQTYALLGKTLMKNEADESRWCLANGKFDNPTPEGQAVLDAFAKLIKASAPFRAEYGRNHPELQLDHWDAGFRQMRDLFKEVCPNELKEYKAALKALKDKMRPQIYELGFLRK